MEQLELRHLGATRSAAQQGGEVGQREVRLADEIVTRDRVVIPNLQRELPRIAQHLVRV